MNVPATVAGDVLNRHLDVVLAIKELQKMKWTKSNGGYRFPEGTSWYSHASLLLLVTNIATDHAELPGMSFVKDDIIVALSIGHSVAGNDAKLFSRDVRRKVQSIDEWVKDVDGHAGDRFRDMPVSEFKRYIEDRVAKYAERKQSTKGKGKGKKRAPSSSSDGSVVIGKKKGKSTRSAATSDDMDDDSH